VLARVVEERQQLLHIVGDLRGGLGHYGRAPEMPPNRRQQPTTATSSNQ
jgi:hypothetical protein